MRSQQQSDRAQILTATSDRRNEIFKPSATQIELVFFGNKKILNRSNIRNKVGPFSVSNEQTAGDIRHFFSSPFFYLGNVHLCPQKLRQLVHFRFDAVFRVQIVQVHGKPVRFVVDESRKFPQQIRSRGERHVQQSALVVVLKRTSVSGVVIFDRKPELIEYFRQKYLKRGVKVLIFERLVQTLGF